jgi:hypothetical protein
MIRLVATRRNELTHVSDEGTRPSDACRFLRQRSTNVSSQAEACLEYARDFPHFEVKTCARFIG